MPCIISILCDAFKELSHHAWSQDHIVLYDDFIIDSGLMWLVAVPLAWILVKYTNLSLVYIYSIIVGFDILKFLASYYFVKKDKWLNNLTLSTKEG